MKIEIYVVYSRDYESTEIQKAFLDKDIANEYSKDMNERDPHYTYIVEKIILLVKLNES